MTRNSRSLQLEATMRLRCGAVKTIGSTGHFRKAADIGIGASRLACSPLWTPPEHPPGKAAPGSSSGMPCAH